MNGTSVPDSQARLLATGSLAQQASQVAGLLALFAIITVLGRRLSLTEFGVYGLFTSLAGYLLVVQNSAASAGIRTMAAAADDVSRVTAFSTAATLYAAAGAITGLLIFAIGMILSFAVDLSSGLEHQAQVGSLLLGLVTAIGWPATVYRDGLRASQLFVQAATIEVISLVAYVGLVLSLTFADAQLAVLIGVSGTIPVLAGLGCAIAARRRRSPFRFRWRAVSRSMMRQLAQLAGYVSFTEAAGTIVYALDRIVLGLFRSAATVGLYEGPVRAHNVIRALNAATSVTVLPTASRYVAEGDERRMRELLVRGVRYTLGLSVPLTVTGMLLAGPMLEVWLGPEFREGATAMAILLSYWLLNGCTGVLSGIIIATGRARTLAVYAWIVAPTNLLMSVALTPSLGLEGVVIGTAVPYFVAFPFVMRIVLAEVTVPVGVLLRESFLPAYSLGLALTAALAIVRITVSPETLGTVVATASLGIGSYWALFYGCFMSGAERRLVREVAGGVVTPRRLRRRPT